MSGREGDTIADRLRGERIRLDLSQTAMAALAGVRKGTQLAWEAGRSSPTAAALASFAEAGADVQFIVTGKRVQALPPLHLETASAIARRAIGSLAPADRHRLLLDLLTEELRG